MPPSSAPQKQVPILALQLRYRYRCEPTPGQKIALSQTFGCARVVWNDALREWLGEVSASMLQQSAGDLDKAFRNWWKSKGNLRAPRFKRRSHAQSVRICGKEFRPTDHGVHKLSTRLIRENQAVVLEDLNVSGMLKNRKLSRAIADAGWRMLRTLLEYKAKRYGRELKTISRWEPTSRTCSACGHRDGKKSLGVRTWTCSACGAVHDRDVNVAQNILSAGLAERLNGRGAKSRTGLPVSGSEASTRLDQGGQRCLA